MKCEFPKWLYRGDVDSAVLVKSEDEREQFAAQGYGEEPQEKAETEPEAKRRPGRPRKVTE